MSHTTYGYTREKLGFEPDREERRLTHYAGVQSSYTNGNGQHTNGHNGHSKVDTMTGGVYEENLSKFKDERDAIQKKTFTKWVNKHLKKAGRNVRDLFEDLRDGHNLLSLLEVLSGEILPRERGRMRFHAIQNVETALRFLRYKEIKLVNIRGEDIVDGNPKLTLGLIWTIILHFQISDIVVGQEDLTAKEALLRWAQKTTHKYPGVEVRDFTQSWRDGLALNAIIHRNRPDLLDWRQVEKREVRERIDLAFHVMDREYGVTRLLDPEDVDTPEPDEKSIITYVSQLYDVFPEPPPGHPLFDAEAAKKFDQFKELASSLHQWIREHTTIMQDRNFPNTLIEMKRLSEESNRFRVDDIPPRLHEKEKLFAVFRDIERQMKDANFELDRDLYPDNIERSWSQLMMLFQERDTMIHEEIARLEKLQRLAEKIHQEAKMTDSKLDDIEAWIEDEAKRIDHLHPKDAKNNCEQIERELARTEETIKSMFSDVQILRDNRFSQSQDLHRSVKMTYDHWAAASAALRQNLLIPMNENVGTTTVVKIEADGNKTVITMGGGVHSDTNTNFRFIQECLDWVDGQLTQLKESEYGTDMQTVKVEYDRHQKEHKVIDQFQGNVEKCREAEVKFHGEELKIYGERMTILQKAYNELLVLSNKRVSDLHSLYDFMQAAHAELTWLNDREDKESGRDWSDKNLKLTEVEQYYEKLMSELEKRETQFSSVMDRGESLIIGHHSASQVIEAHMLAMQNKWAWLLQLTLCLETHLKHTGTSHRFFHECSVAEEFMTQKEEILNNHFAQADFKLEDGENLLKEMQQLREELAGYEDEVQRLIEASGDIVPLRQRRERLRNPVEAIAICKYSSTTISINRDEVVTVKDNTNQKAWKFTTSRGQAGEAPGVMFLLPPPDQEAVDTAEKLKRHYDRVITLWQKKHLRMRQNMIFATIKVVKSWDFEQYLSMDKETRTNIRRALNEDAEKLIQEGEQNDPQLRRLEREIAEVNRLFDEWERRALMEDEKRNALKLFTDMCNTLEMTLSEYEKTIIKVCKAPLPRDVESLQTLVISHKEFESDLQSQEPTVNNVKSLFNNIPQKTPKDQAKLDKVLDQWDRIWSYSSYYVERLKTVEITLTGLEEVTTVVTEFEMKLASYDSMPSDMDNLRKAHDDLMTLEADIQDKQGLIDQLQEDVKHVRPSVEKTRPNVAKNPDVDRLEEDVNRMSKRWGNCCMQVVERLRSCEAACELLEKYNMSYQTETNWMDELDSKLRNLEELEEARAKEAWEKHVQCFDEAGERAPHVEQVNTLGGRYVREAKIYDLRLERFQCDLEEVHPSLDGSIKKRNKQSGADTVSQELDLFNLKYQRLCESLRSRLEAVGDESKDDPEIQSKLTNLLLAPLAVVRTFREFLGTDLESASQNRVIEEEVITKATNSTETENQIENQESQENQKSVALVTITNKESSPVKTNVVVAKNGDSSLNGDSTDSHSVDTGNTLTFNEIRTGKRIELASAGISTDLSVGAGGIVDPITGQPLSLDEAIRCGLVDTSTGEFVDPKTGRRYSLGEAVSKGLIDPQLAETLSSNCGIFDPKSGRHISLLEAIDKGLFDPKEKSFVDPKTGKPVTVNDAVKLGFILQEKQAVQEKFRQASENLDDLNKWLDGVERDIASQEVPYEDVDGLKNQINALKQIKDDVDEHNRPVNNTLDIIAELVETGADVLSSAELNKLQADGKQLKTRYDNVSNNSDRLLKRMVGALEELSKFRGEVSAFRNWMEKAYKVLEDKERQLANLNKVQGNTSDIKDFVSDVMTHGADLKFLTISGQKFVDLSKDYVGCLNEFRMALRQTNLKLSESQVSEEVGHVSTAYHELLARANSLADRLSNVGGKYKDYNDAVERAKKWLKETEPKVAKICNEPVAAEPRVVEDQLNRAKALNNEIIANGQLIDAAKQAAANLLASLDNSSMSKEERRAIENTPIELQQRYDALRVMMAERCADLDSALVACQGVQDALANIAAWLDGTDKQLEQIMKPASLMRERLDEQMRQLKVLQSDVISHEPSIHKMYESAQQFIQNSSNVRETKKIETKVKEVQKKFEVLVKTVQTREMFFNEISTTLQVFTSQVENFEVWYLETIDILESRELLQMDADESAQKIDELVKRKEQMKAQFDEMIKNGKGLVNKKDTTDKGPCTETIKELEEKWKELGDILGERQASNRLRKQSLNAYEALREQVYMWLSKMEQRVEELEPLAVDIDMLNKQMNDLKPLTQEYTGYSKTIDKVNELGMQYDNVLRGSIDNGSPSRRSSVSPRKPSLTPSLLSSGPRRPSASPKFGGSPGSPIRRESGIPMFQEASPIQTQLSEINNRYDMIGIRLGDRDRELANMREEVKKYLDMLKGLAQFIEKQERAFPQESIPTDKKEADKQLKVLKGILDQLYEHQGQLDTAKVNIKDLLKKKPDAPGAEILDDTLTEITVRWKDLQEKCKERANLLDELKDFHDIHDNLNNWLNSKGKLMNILGPIASDPRLVQNQMSQIQVMKEEFVEKQPNKERFNDIGETILDTAGSSPDGRKVEDKLDNINRKWDDLLNQLEERERALDAVSGPTRDFLNLSNKLSDNLSKISDDLDDIAVSKADAEQKLKTLTGVAQNLDNQRPLFSEVMAIGDQLMEILTDPASKSEIKGKMGQVERQFNNCQKKLDNAMAELENSAKEGREFEAQCAAAQDWLQEMEALLSEKLAVSADRNTLMDQVADFEPIYKEVMSKEHEIIMVLNRGKDVMTRSSKADASNIKKNLDIVEKSWQKVRKIAQERQTRLNTCMEYCKKFYGAQDKFLPWLEKAESQISKMESISMVLSELKKQEKELQTFRNDVNRHGSEFDSNYSGGDSFQTSCDTDKEIVKEEIGHMKERWDNLNYFISERAQTLADILAKLGDFNENARDLENGLKRAEEKLKNTDNSPKDPRLLDKIKGLLDEAKDLEKGFGKVQKGGEDLLNDADAIGADGQPIADTVNSLGDRLGNLRDRLEDKAEDLKNAGAAVGEFNEKAKDLGNALAMLDDELNKMGPIARDLNTLYKQKDEVQSFLQRISKKHSEVATILEDSKQLINSGVVPNPRELQDTVAGLQKSVDKLEQRGASRDKDVDDMIVKVQTFYDHYGSVMDDIQEVIREEKNLGAIAGDTESIKSQQEEFKQFQVKVVSAVSKEVEKSNRSGQGLIQSAASGVNTGVMEKDLEAMNDLWNSLKQALAERERKLDQGLLQSGKYGEALGGLMSWMDEMEDMMQNQKPPSADYKVVKAQVQEQKFVQKLLNDRKGAVASLVKTGQEIAASADPSEKRRIEGEVQALQDRYGSLNQKCADRMDLLEDAMKMAKEYADKLGPLEKWLDKTEKKIKEMETVPTEEDQIQRRIREHEKVHDDIIGKQPTFDDLADVASALMQVVGDEDAQALADKIEELTNRYAALVTNSDNIAQLLQDSMAGLRNLVMAYEDLLGWMEECETRLASYKILSVFSEKLMEQTEQLHDVTEEIVKRQPDVDNVVAIGNELMKHITNEESLSLKDKLDSLQRKYNDLASKAADLLKNAQDMLPLVQNFHQSHNRISDWMNGVEGIIQSLDTYSLEEQEGEIHRLEGDIQEHRPLLEGINLTGPQLCQLSPGDGARAIEGLVTRDNRRFEAICEQVQRRGERIALAKQKSGEVLGDIDELLSWFREVEGQIREADPPSHEPEVIRVQLKEHKALNDDISSQKGRVRDVLSNAKKVLRESAQTADTEQVREKMDDLKETMETVISLSSERLGILEQALPLAEHFYETHGEINEWLDDIEREVMTQMNPGMRPDQIAKQQEIVRSLMQSVQDHKPVLDRLNKTGGALLRLIVEDDADRVQDIVETDNQRYNNLKADLRERMQALEDAMHDCSQFTDKLDGMLNSLEDTKDQLVRAEPISAHPEKIKEQIDDNNAIIDDLGKKEVAYEAVKRAAEDVIQKAPNKQDPAVKDIKKKLDKLCGLWNEVQGMAKNRGDNLEDALALAEKFWDELQQVMANLKELEQHLASQEPPAVEPKAIEAQKRELQEIKRGIDGTKPVVDKCRVSGSDLLSVVGEPEKPELKRHIEDLDNAWESITSMYAKREKNLLDAMEKAMEFHDMLNSLLEFLSRSEAKYDNMGAIGTDIATVKKQIEELKKFKDEVDPWMVKVEALNRSLRRQADDLTERTSPDQARAIKEPLAEVNKRWTDLNKAIVIRQKELEHALLRLGQFQHALSELLVWIERTDKTLDTLKPVYGDPQVIEVELAKLKVIVNDIQAHQSSVDTLNDAGRQIIETEKGSREASQTQQKLNELNSKWNALLGKGEDRQAELEDALREAQAFNQEVQDMLMWLNDVDTALSTSKPVGGLPETAKDQLDRFMEVYHDLEATGPKIEALLGRGNDYLKKSKDGQATNLSNNLKTLKARWDNIINRANDKKIKLEIALKEALEFHEALQSFIDWLTNAEKTLGNLKPVSRVMETILMQIEEHKEFQAEVSSQRETMLSLDKKGTHLKYFSQKQDVILIKNLLVSVQHRWEKVVSKSAERTRALDYGYKEAKEFHDAWDFMMGWLDDGMIRLDEMSKEVKNDPEKIKQQIMRHKEFQKELGEKQPMYDSTMKTGKGLIGKAPKTDEPTIKNMMTELKNKWNNLCNLSVERQRKLEEALLFSGQFKDALKALMDWLANMEKALDDKQPVHGDLDTVIGLVEQHKNFEEELNSRTEQVEQLKQTAEELLRTAESEDAIKIRSQVTELTNRWENVWDLSKNKTKRLEDALKQAEELHKFVSMLLEWLSDAEMKLRFAGPLPEDEEEVNRQLAEHAKFMMELKEKEKDKDYTIDLAQEILKKCHPDAVQVIKHWITIIQSRWDEVASWALQRQDKLEEHLRQLQELLALLDELMQWLIGKEHVLTTLEQEPLPDDLEIIRELIVEHQGFMDGLTERQPEIDNVCKPMRPKSTAPSSRRTSKAKGPGRDSREGSADIDPSRRPSQYDPDREGSPSKSRKSSFYGDGYRDQVSPSRDYPKPWLDFLYMQSGYPDRNGMGPGSRRTSRASPGDRATPDRRGGPRFPDRKGSRASVSQGEGGIKNPRAKALWDKWRHVWMMAWERDRRLKDKLNYLQELEKVKNFNWEEWRKRYLKHHNNKKSRVQDFFRKLDDDGDGYCPRDEFIDGILKAKFPSSKLEMNAVADKFDHGDGMIDWREFMVALRPDWEERGPLTDTQRIDDEIKRQVAQCTCRQKFKVFQVGEGKYRFGDSQKLRLVRILRSTVMVRVGGGWCALDEFLVKNDPCRAKGRTNVELREQFTLASGVSQSMTPFKSKAPPAQASPTSSVSGETRNGMQGPITKIKEKSERSLGMNVRSSVDYGYQDETSSFSRRTSTQGRNSLTPGSQPGSRPGSRPPSRHGSNMSLNSDDEGRRGSGVRRTSSMRSGARGLRPTPVGFGSGVPRKTSTPGDRKRTDSNSSTDRTPLSARMRSKSYITPRPSKMIKSTSESNIPVFVGCHSTNTSTTSTPNRTNNSRPNSRNTSISGPPGLLKARQPSSSNIPVPTNNRTRTPSGSGPRGSLQRSGSNMGQKATAYSADGSKFGSSNALRNAVNTQRDWQ
eukprot:GFUD01001391.1.p1 GENE.GFUD01001391.1~~GFUD01001391.1.p1  ORF type:complete len:5580 (+),score=1489.94 GFUD01001391.1:543-17282(+)